MNFTFLIRNHLPLQAMFRHVWGICPTVGQIPQTCRNIGTNKVYSFLKHYMIRDY